jgi:hypothetical protein
VWEKGTMTEVEVKKMKRGTGQESMETLSGVNDVFTRVVEPIKSIRSPFV